MNRRILKKRAKRFMDSFKPIWGDDILREHPPGMIGGDNSG